MMTSRNHSKARIAGMSSNIPFQPGAQVVAYLRDSGGDDQELSTFQQREFLTSWCQDNGLILSRVFVDAASPGSSTVGRDQFMEMISHFHDPACVDAGVIVWKLSRFSRDIDDSMYYRADLRRRGYILHSIHDNIPDTSDGRIFEALIDWRNKKFLEDLSLDVKRGLEHNINQYGAVPGIPPKGFKRETFNIGKHRNGTPRDVSRWVPDPATWDLCRQAWVMRSEGKPIRQIHQQLHLFGSLASYTTFFTNRIYIGELVYGKTTVPDYCEPMISVEIWDLVQNIARKNSADYNPMKGLINARHPRRISSRFILSGLLYCARCGALMNGDTVRFKNGKKLEYYQCGRAHRRLECTALRIPKEAIETAVIDQLKDYVLNPDNLDMVEEEREKNQQEKAGNQKSELVILKGQIEDNQRRIKNLVNKIAEDDAAPRSLVETLRELEHKDDTLKMQLDALRTRITKEFSLRPSAGSREDLIKALEFMEVDNDPALIKKGIQSMVKQVMAEREGDMVRGMVYFHFPEIDAPTNKSHRRESNP